MKLLNWAARLRPRATRDASGKGVETIIGKTVLILMTFAMLALPSLCRTQSDEASVDSPTDGEPSVNSAIEVARADSRAQRENIISTAMNFNDKDAAAFWPIYRQYEYERTALDDGRVAVIKEYTDKNATLTDGEAKSMAERMFAYDSGVATLKKKYYRKFNKVLAAFTVTKFFQLDRRIDLLQDMNVEATLPPLTRPQYAIVSK
jgi:hypothetical protein